MFLSVEPDRERESERVRERESVVTSCLPSDELING